MDKHFKIFVDNDEIYSGRFDEIPDKYRKNIVESLSEWGTVVGKRGLNEMIYSLFVWYYKKKYFCNNCLNEFDESGKCPECGSVLEPKREYKRNEKITRILDCIGMINRIEISE